MREHIIHAEKCTRDLIDHTNGELMTATHEYRDLTRPVRRRSHYPTRLALQNALNKMREAGQDAMMLSDYLLDELKVIAQSARRELENR